VLLALSVGSIPVSAQTGIEEGNIQLDEVSYICSARLQLRHPRQCTSLGPASHLAEYARQGIYPSDPIPASAVDRDLGYLPYNYLSVSGKDVKVYASVGDALNSRNAVRSLGKGFLYLSWIDRYDEENQVIYQLASGLFVRGDHVSRISTPQFLGLTFARTPKNSFGWIMRGDYSSIAPGFEQPQTSKFYNRYEIVQVYDSVKIDDFNWYMIAPGEWIEQRQIAVVTPENAPPDGVDGDTWISVDLYEQTFAAYEQGEMVFATAVSSGLRGYWTRPGIFQVYQKLTRTPMSGAFEVDRSDYYYLEDVPWVLYYDEARAIHGTYWHNNYGYQQSHGCVNLAPADARWIFEWAEEGTWIYVFDSSGETPVDPNNYTPGGA
jgi:hypothetical protein